MDLNHQFPWLQKSLAVGCIMPQHVPGRIVTFQQPTDGMLQGFYNTGTDHFSVTHRGHQYIERCYGGSATINFIGGITVTVKVYSSGLEQYLK